jgi:hypothetical protein
VLACLVALVLCWAGYSRLSSQPANASVSLAPKTEGSNIYFVPIGNFPSERLEPLIQYYRQKYNLEIAVVNSIPVDPATRDDSRRQLMAERLVARVRNAVPEHTYNPKEILIGFTSEDIYPTSQNW